jgi:hypothetical protein
MVQRSSPGLMTQYQTMNGFRVSASHQQAPVAGYITNHNIMNQAQIPMQMGVMQAQYQDPMAAAAAAQQNTVYATYGYINGGLMQPLNGTMRR